MAASPQIRLDARPGDGRTAIYPLSVSAVTAAVAAAMATMMYPTLTKSQSMRSKRKSAVELLAESKSFYVKSETVRDTTQAQPARPPPNFAIGYMRSKSVTVGTRQADTYCRPISLPQCNYNKGLGFFYQFVICLL